MRLVFLGAKAIALIGSFEGTCLVWSVSRNVRRSYPHLGDMKLGAQLTKSR